MATTPTNLTCFISAPMGANTLPLREVLEERGIKWTDLTKVPPAHPVAAAVIRAIDDSDFICAVMSDNQSSNSVFFEAGIACAMDKPMLLIVAPTVAVPVEMAGIPSTNAKPDDKTAIRFQVDALIKTLGFQRKKTVRSAPRKRVAERALRPALEGINLETDVALLFEAAGYTVAGPANSGKDDVAIWSVGHPAGLIGFPSVILVECKNWSTAVGTEQVAYFITKLRNRGCSFGIFVAIGGVTGEPGALERARADIALALAEKIAVVVITRAELGSVRSVSEFVRLLQQKFLNLMVTGSSI